MVSDSMSRFHAAIVAADDDEVEALVPQLVAGDEPSLIALASSDDSNKRWWALRALADCGTQVSVETVGAGLFDVDSSVRAASVLALAHLYGRLPASVRPAMGDMAKLLDDEEGIVRQAAADALAMCGDDAVGALIFRAGNGTRRSTCSSCLRLAQDRYAKIGGNSLSAA